MALEYESRSRYLSLALDARKLIDRLVSFVEEGRRNEELDAMIGNFLASLRTASGEDMFTPTQNQLSFGHYEQITTLDEVTTEQSRGELIRKLGELLQDQDAEKRRQDAFDAIQFFYALESRALHHYHQTVGSLAS